MTESLFDCDEFSGLFICSRVLI